MRHGKKIIPVLLILALSFVFGSKAVLAQQTTKEVRDKIDAEGIYIPLQIKLPIPDCNAERFKTDVKKPDGSTQSGVPGFKCENNFTAIGVIDVRFLITALFQFGIIILGSVMVLLCVVGGLLLLTSAGNAKKSDQATTLFKNAGTSLVIALFSYVILFQINPDLVNLNLTDRGNLGKIETCKEIKDAVKCAADDKCVWSNNVCTNFNFCSSATTQTACKSPKCEWLEKGTLKLCLDVNVVNPFICKSQTTDAACNSSTGCIWNPIDTCVWDQPVEGATDPCVGQNQPGCAGLAGSSCNWKVGGACVNQTAVFNNVTCTNSNNQNPSSCPISCYWNGTKCMDFLAVGTSCRAAPGQTTTNICGPFAKCATDPAQQTGGLLCVTKDFSVDTLDTSTPPEGAIDNRPYCSPQILTGCKQR